MEWIKGDLIETHDHEKHYSASYGTSMMGIWVEIDGEFSEIIDIERM